LTEYADLPLIAEILDTFGHVCTSAGCEEFRTVGFALVSKDPEIDDEEEAQARALVVVCRTHLNDFFDTYVWTRRALIIDDPEG